MYICIYVYMYICIYGSVPKPVYHNFFLAYANEFVESKDFERAYTLGVHPPGRQLKITGFQLGVDPLAYICFGAFTCAATITITTIDWR